MSLTLIVLVALVLAALFWVSSRAAAENATRHGRAACEDAGVQWLDQSVHQVRIRVRRNPAGQLSLERQFRFEYSSGGTDRHAGMITLLGPRLSSLVGPMAAVETLH
jgi:hypothetical protein